MKVCRDCGVELVLNYNWTEYNHRQNNNICIECHSSNRRIKKATRPFETRLRDKIQNTLSSHRRRGFEVIGSWKEYTHTYTEGCNYCGFVFDIFSKDRFETGSMDVVNPKKIITPDNVQWLCHRCNGSKQDMSHDEYVRHCQMMVDKYLKK